MRCLLDPNLNIDCRQPETSCFPPGTTNSRRLSRSSRRPNHHFVRTGS